jgi:hypothetical protein
MEFHEHEVELQLIPLLLLLPPNVLYRQQLQLNAGQVLLLNMWRFRLLKKLQANSFVLDCGKVA